MTMTIHAKFEHGAQLKIDHTPVSALAAGDIVHLGNGLIGIANRAIAAAEQDALDISPNSVYRVKKAVGTGVVFAQGDEVFWDTVAETAVVDSNANKPAAKVDDLPSDYRRAWGVVDLQLSTMLKFRFSRHCH